MKTIGLIFLGVLVACGDSSSGSRTNGVGDSGTDSAESGDTREAGSGSDHEAECVRACLPLVYQEGDGRCSASVSAAAMPFDCSGVTECTKVMAGEAAAAGCQTDCTFREDPTCPPPSLRGTWSVLRTLTGTNGDASCGMPEESQVSTWTVADSGDVDWPLKAIASGGTSYSPIQFKQDKLDVTGTATGPAGTMTLILMLEDDGVSLMGAETISTDTGCVVSRDLSGARQ